MSGRKRLGRAPGEEQLRSEVSNRHVRYLRHKNRVKARVRIRIEKCGIRFSMYDA